MAQITKQAAKSLAELIVEQFRRSEVQAAYERWLQTPEGQEWLRRSSK